MTSLLVNSWDIADVGGLWTGLTDAGQKGVYYWSDRSSLDYTSWLNTQPDERNLVGSCVQATLQPGRMNWLFWQDVNCNRTLPYACAMPPSKQLYPGLNTVTEFKNLRNFADMINCTSEQMGLFSNIREWLSNFYWGFLILRFVCKKTWKLILGTRFVCDTPSNYC